VRQVRTGVAVTGISDGGRRVTVQTAEGPVTATAAVVCAGPWTSGLLAGSGIAVPAEAALEQVGYLVPATDPPPAMPIFLGYDTQILYGLPVPGSPLYKIGLHNSGPPTGPHSQDHRPDERLIAQLAELARRYLPDFTPEPVQTERCVYDNCPDEDFIVDRIGNVVIGSGTSGHGFKFGPLLGEWLADLAAGGDTDQGAARFSLGRFSHAP
jgi:sarcosine oxidase